MLVIIEKTLWKSVFFVWLKVFDLNGKTFFIKIFEKIIDFSFKKIYY
jgi:hypothetical protein